VTAKKANRRGPGRPPAAKRKSGVSRRELIDAAVEVFAERGYQASTIEDVIRRAGLSKGTFYFNFTSKDDLFAAVLHERLDAPARELMAITADAPGDVPTAGSVSTALAALIQNERGALLLLQDYWAQAARDEQLAIRYRTRQSALRDALAAALEARHEHTGVPLTLDAHRLAQAFIALAQGLALESVVDPAAVDAALFGDILNLVYDGLVARATTAPNGV
jgi:AcrR family transcriptional regulator